ncbi:MAG: U32 family peptidase C-terminal domain-containing protein [Patescibacteria group bacterium]
MSINLSQNMELIAPAGNLAKLETAFCFGADAVYCGIPDFSLRTRINEFNLKALKQGIKFAHERGKNVYVTLNIFSHNRHLSQIEKHVKLLKDLKPDGLIISDPGILSIVKKICPTVKLHLSTQANCTNWQSAKFWYEQGISRIILAREVTLNEIKEIHKRVPKVELECFVHGAMCMSYSGRCLLSKYYNDRSANLGDCTQPCRWGYEAQSTKHKTQIKHQIQNSNENYKGVYIREKTRPDDLLIIDEDAHGSYIMNSKDLCLVDYLEKLKRAGITAFKIEGRAKSVYYVGNTVKVYRDAIDKTKMIKDPELELKKCQNRGFTTGFLFGKEKCEQKIEASHEKCDWEFCGQIVADTVTVGTVGTVGTEQCSVPTVPTSVEHDCLIRVRVHNQIFVGDEIEFVLPHEKNFKYRVEVIYDKNGKGINEAHGGQGEIVYLPVKKIIPKLTLLRRRLTKENK